MLPDSIRREVALKIYTTQEITAIRRAVALNTCNSLDNLGKFSFDEDMCGFVLQNPTVTSLVERTKESHLPEFLAQMAVNPIRFVQETAALNSYTPWESVAIALSKTPVGVWMDLFRPRYGYVGECMKIPREALRVHRANRDNILGKLKELNFQLYDSPELRY